LSYHLLKQKEEYIAPSPLHAELVLNYLLAFHPLPLEFQQEFKSRLFDFKIQKGDFLLKSGEICKNFYFIIKGIVIGYTPHNNKTLTSFICAEGDSVSSISGMYGDRPSIESLYVAEDSHLIALPAEALVKWLETSIDMNIIIRKILEIFYSDANERSTVVKIGTAREKCNYYFAHFPHHIDRIPAKYIASFLEINIDTFNRVLKEREGKADGVNIQTTKLIAQYMTEKMAFKQHGLTLLQMSKDLNIPIHSLSYLLNFHYKQSFNAFINKFRIDFIKEKLQHKEKWAHLKIEALGNEGGFSSRSAFFAEFKKHTGFSPATYAAKFAEEGPKNI
jgi:CRP-like cAMP-binding protein